LGFWTVETTSRSATEWRKDVEMSESGATDTVCELLLPWQEKELTKKSRNSVILDETRKAENVAADPDSFLRKSKEEPGVGNATFERERAVRCKIS